MVKGIPDRDVAFYIKEKDPGTVSEVCTLYERFNALTSDEPPRRTSVKGAKSTDTEVTDRPGHATATHRRLGPSRRSHEPADTAINRRRRPFGTATASPAAAAGRL